MVSAHMGKAGVGMVISGFLLPRNGFFHPSWSWLVRFTFSLVRAQKLSEPTLLILLRSCGHLSGSLSIAVMPSIHLWSGGHPCHLCSPQGHLHIQQDLLFDDALLGVFLVGFWHPPCLSLT